jgi:hypothetical protein
MAITTNPTALASYNRPTNICTWCAMTIADGHPAFVWVEENFVLRGHAECFSDWFIRVLPDAYCAITGKRVVLPKGDQS